MPISMECPSCLHGFSLPNELAGRKIKCPACQFTLFATHPKTKVETAAVPPPDTAVVPEARIEPKKEPPPVAVLPQPFVAVPVGNPPQSRTGRSSSHVRFPGGDSPGWVSWKRPARR